MNEARPGFKRNNLWVFTKNKNARYYKYDIVQFNKGAKRTDLGVTSMTLTFNNQSTNKIISVS